MNQQEIKNKIDKYNEEIEQNSNFNFFILNKEITSVNDKITILQKECKKLGHIFENGKCKYCYTEEKING